MHIRASVSSDTDACAAPHLTNLKWLTNSTVSVNDGSAINLNAVAQEDCVRIQVTSDTNISIIATRLYAYDGTNVDNSTQNVTVKAFEHGSANWSENIGSRANALSLGDSTTAGQTHDFYFGISISPTSTGASNLFVLRFEADIQ